MIRSKMQYSLFYGQLREDGVCEYTECKDLPKEEIEDLNKVCNSLNIFYMQSHSNYSVEAALKKIRGLREDDAGPSLKQLFEMEHAVREYLWEYFAVKGYYDSMCKKYQNEELIKLHEIMTDSWEYHLATVFRNYITHAGGIVSNYMTDITQALLYANRKILLERLEKLGWSKDKQNIEILKSLPDDSIDIKFVIETSYRRLTDIQNCLNKILLSEQKENLTKITRYHKLVNPEKYNTKRWMILGSDIVQWGKEICLVDWDAYMNMQSNFDKA